MYTEPEFQIKVTHNIIHDDTQNKVVNQINRIMYIGFADTPVSLSVDSAGTQHRNAIVELQTCCAFFNLTIIIFINTCNSYHMKIYQVTIYNSILNQNLIYMCKINKSFVNLLISVIKRS